MDRQDRAGTRSEVDMIAHGQILRDLQDYEQQLPEWVRRNDCLSLFYEVERSWDQPVSTLFVVLPSDLDSWDDNDSSTHHFRIYFFCNVWVYYTVDKKTSHPHFSNHPGFRLNRAKEFLQTYGNHALRVLQMIKRYEDHNKSPSLYTFQTLRGCDPNITVGQLSRNSIVFLIDKAISYLLDLSLPKQLNVRIGSHKIAAIKSYLVVQKDVGAEGELYRSIKNNELVNWFCKEHRPQKWNSESLDELKDHVRVHGGHIDVQQATLRVELGSETEAIQFLSLLKRTGYRFDISIKLKWNASRSIMETIYREITQTPSLVLEIDSSLPVLPILEYRAKDKDRRQDGDPDIINNNGEPTEEYDIAPENASLRRSANAAVVDEPWKRHK
ncbi:hypothetical protein MVEG_01277 [Podila verticillata NRRL 6337]|nr:hypothetical protein MVEG_01277 [Podila verticillata NRRL 6337]